MELNGIRGIVTGAARGLGFYFAMELARAGAKVAAGDINDERLAQLHSASAGLQGKIIPQRLDVADEKSITEFVHRFAEEFDGINLLVNNAGVLRDGVIAQLEDGWLKKMPTAQWQQVLDVNLTGPFLMAREVLTDILKRDTSPAVIVNISSITRAGNPGQSNYSASKSGLDALTRTWALELAHFGVRVGGIAPGLIDTPILDNISEQAMKHLVASIPLGRIGKPHEIWLALKFIIECDYFTGRTIDIDGGASF
jgi:3-oxoacyl-[acyl-carrier protein] reductase